MSRFRRAALALYLLFLACPTLAQTPAISGRGYVEPSIRGPGYRALKAFLSAAVANGDVPGIVVLVTGPGGVIYHQAFGKLDVAGNVPMPRDAIFRIASMTKALTSTAVMMLVEEGKVGLDDPIARYLPALAYPQVLSRVDLAAGAYDTRPAKRPITIRHLLTHTSGIGYSWSDPGLALVEKRTGQTSETALPLVHEPGEQWTYGASTKVLGDLIEKVTGERVADFMKRRVFVPLRMKDTGWSVPASERPRVATSHRKVNGTLAETPNPAELVAEARGDGRLFSTAVDYGQFMQMILNRGETSSMRLLKAETVDAMGRPQTGGVKVRTQPVVLTDLAKPFPKGAGEDVWGLGFQIANPERRTPDHRRPGSMSWAGINNTFFWIDAKARIGVVVLMQVLPFYDETALRVLDGIETRVYKHLRLVSAGNY